MVCSNCDHQWCWFCGLPSNEDGLAYFHIVCGIFVEVMAEKGWKKILIIIGIVLLIILGPAIAAILLAGYYVFGILCVSFMIIEGRFMSSGIK